MSEHIVIRCDNPTCESIGESESEQGTRRGKLAPPFGWIQVPNIGFYGCGPYIKNLVVCGKTCLLPAFEHEVQWAER